MYCKAIIAILFGGPTNAMSTKGFPDMLIPNLYVTMVNYPALTLNPDKLLVNISVLQQGNIDDCQHMRTP